MCVLLIHTTAASLRLRLARLPRLRSGGFCLLCRVLSFVAAKLVSITTRITAMLSQQPCAYTGGLSRSVGVAPSPFRSMLRGGCWKDTFSCLNSADLLWRVWCPRRCLCQRGGRACLGENADRGLRSRRRFHNNLHAMLGWSGVLMALSLSLFSRELLRIIALFGTLLQQGWQRLLLKHLIPQEKTTPGFLSETPGIWVCSRRPGRIERMLETPALNNSVGGDDTLMEHEQAQR